MTSMRFLSLGAVAITIHAAIPPGMVRSAVYCIVAVAALIAVFVGVRHRAEVALRSWWIMLAGLTLWVVGDIYVSIRENMPDGVPEPSIADAAYIGGYLALAAALLTIRSRDGRVLGLPDLLEACVVTAGFGLASWVLAGRARTDGGQIWLGVFYTEFDVFVLMLVISVMLSRQSVRTYWLLGAAMAVMVLSDYTMYVVNTVPDQVIDVGFLSSFVLFGTAALYVEPRRARSPSVSASRLAYVRLAILTAALAMTPLVMAVLITRGEPVGSWGPIVVVAVSVVVVFGALRMYFLLRLLHRQATALRASALVDPVTTLGNRRYLTEQLERALAAPDRDLALLVVDLRRFSDVNETFGYTVGDGVLAEVGGRLTHSVSEEASVVRLGGDEFAILLLGDPERESVLETAHLLLRTVGESLMVRDIRVALECTVGVAFSADVPRPTPEALLQRAYAAVTDAKSRQPRVVVWDDTMDTDRIDQIRRMGELENAIAAGELEVHYQPCVSLATGGVAGFEALLRWRHPREGLLLPGAFLPSAEQTGLLPVITAFVVDAALTACRRWHDVGLSLDVAVNISARDLVDPALLHTVRDALDRHGVAGSSVIVEITESTAMLDPERSIAALEAIRGLGVSIAIDDYGTGYSSLAYLATLPVRYLKMDRAFVTTIVTDEMNRAIVRSTIELAHTLDLGVVAEGVEDADTLEMLRRMSCDYAQGFHVGHPVPDDRVVAETRAIDSRPDPVAM